MTEETIRKGMKGKRVLITGGLGFIGSNLAHRCLALGAEVTVFDCLDPRSGGNLYNVADIKDFIELRFHDILNFDQISSSVVGMDIVFNCAASTSHPFSMREPWLDMDVNGRGVINLVEAVRRFNREVKLVHLGASTQIGRLQFQPADETHPEFPTDIYSANKSVSEKYTLIYAGAHGLRATVARLTNVFGPRASIHSPDFTFNNYFIGLALQNQDVTIYGEGRQRRNVIYVDDAVEALVLLALSRETDAETFFVASDDHYSVAEVAEATTRVIGTSGVKYVEWPAGRKAVDVGDAIISNQKLKGAVGWVQRFDLESGLQQTKLYYEGCRKEYLRVG